MWVNVIESFRRSLESTYQGPRPRRRLRPRRSAAGIERLEGRALLSAVTYFQTFEGVDWTAAGVGGIGSFGGGQATLTVGNVSGPIVAGYLYWHGIDTGTNGVYDNETITFDGATIVGQSLGLGATGGWGTSTSTSQGFRADVTHLLRTGAQTYSVAGLASKANHNANGASLVVIFQDGDVLNDRDLYILDGNHVSNGPSSDGLWQVQLDDFFYRHGDVRAQLHVADGQSWSDPALVFSTAYGSATFADTIGRFDGTSVSSMGRSRAINGSLWDIHTFNISSAFSGAGSIQLDVSLLQPTHSADSLALVAVFFDTSARPLNTPPVVADVSVSGDEDTVVVGDLSGTDAEDNSLTYSVVDRPSQGQLTLNPQTGRFAYTPPVNFFGTVTFTYAASDGTLSSNVATVTITVVPVNDPPVVSVSPVLTDEDTRASGRIVAWDVDDAVLHFGVVSGPAHGTLVLNGDGTFQYAPHHDYFGSDSFTVSVSDGKVAVVRTVSVDVAPVNDAPVVEPLQVVTDEDVAVAGAVAAVDVDDSLLSFLLIDGPAHGAVALAEDGSFVFTPNADWHGDDSFTVSVSDGKAAPVVAVVTVRVNGVNDPPTVSEGAFEVNRGARQGTHVGAVSASDVDGDHLSYAITGGNESGAFAIDAATGVITVADTGALARHSGSNAHLVVTVSDGNGGTGSAAVTVHITTPAVNFRLGFFGGNTIDLRGFPWVPVVIYSSDSFNVRDIDLNSLRFGSTGSENSLIRPSGQVWHYFTDANRDGKADLVLLYSVKHSGFEMGDTTATLKGSLKSGTTFESTVPVTVTGGKEKKDKQADGPVSNPVAEAAKANADEKSKKK